MDVKFNSLLTNEFDEFNSEYYSVNSVDETLLLNNLLLTFDQKNLKDNVDLFERNFGNTKNYRLGPRSCSTRNASSEKFCEHPGLPEVYEEKVDKCKQYFMPNSSIGDRGQYLRNIDLEARMRLVDVSDSKCDTKKYKQDMCDKNNKDCSLNCGKLVFDKDNIEANSNREYGMNVVKNNNRQYCNSRNQSQNKIKNDFITFQPTKRRDVVKW
jgi:hypothetical protein